MPPKIRYNRKGPEESCLTEAGCLLVPFGICLQQVMDNQIPDGVIVVGGYDDIRGLPDMLLRV